MGGISERTYQRLEQKAPKTCPFGKQVCKGCFLHKQSCEAQKSQVYDWENRGDIDEIYESFLEKSPDGCMQANCRQCPFHKNGCPTQTNAIKVIQATK